MGSETPKIGHGQRKTEKPKTQFDSKPDQNPELHSSNSDSTYNREACGKKGRKVEKNSKEERGQVHNDAKLGKVRKEVEKWEEKVRQLS